jgi:hypothetical protein
MVVPLACVGLSVPVLAVMMIRRYPFNWLMINPGESSNFPKQLLFLTEL